ncbi:MAG: hypothetical protein ABIK92_19325, partial [Pseudomonadota bacterium]
LILLSVILIRWNACASKLEAGAQCISSACWDLCGGCRVIGIPTAISWVFSLSTCCRKGRWKNDKIRPVAPAESGKILSSINLAKA